MATGKAKNVNGMKAESITSRLQKMLNYRAKYEADLSNCHVRVMKGNTKTGRTCYTVSLIPIVDCVNCAECKSKCYDIRNDCRFEDVFKTRAMNSAIHRNDVNRYWKEIGEFVKENNVKLLRINVGGDLNYADFNWLSIVAKQNPECEFLFFTKNYREIGQYTIKYDFPDNVHAILSVWPGMDIWNPMDLPTSHIMWADGSTTAPEYGAYLCKGNCSKCHLNGEGCWTLKKGESVVFLAH